MGKVFDIRGLAGLITSAKDKAAAAAGDLGITQAFRDHVLPPLPPFTRTQPDAVEEAKRDQDLQVVDYERPDRTEINVFGTPMCFPLSIKLKDQPESEWWLLPTEPVITLSGGNILVRRSVAKASNKGNALRGTIKESWAQDDYNIAIEGMFTKKDDWSYPDEDVRKLRGLLEKRQPLDVKCQLFEIFGISRVVVEKFDFPFTKGEENQAYILSGYSDDDWDLLIPID